MNWFKIKYFTIILITSVLLNGCISSDQGPQTPDGFANLAKIQTDQSKIEDAIISYQKIPYYFPEEFNSAAMAEFKTGLLYQEYLNKKDTALHHFEEVVIKYPQTIWAEQALLKKAGIYLEQGDAGSARVDLEKIITHYPSSDFRSQAEEMLQRARLNPY